MAKKVKKDPYVKKRISGIIFMLIAFFYLYLILSPGISIPFISELIRNINKLVGLGKYFLFFFLLIAGLYLLFNFHIPPLLNSSVRSEV